MRILVARHVISLTQSVLPADRDPVADAKWLLDLNGQAGEQIAQRVLQREADDHGANRRRRQNAIAQDERRDHARTAAITSVSWTMFGESIGNAIDAPWIDRQRDDEVDGGKSEQQRVESLEQSAGVVWDCSQASPPAASV